MYIYKQLAKCVHEGHKVYGEMDAERRAYSIIFLLKDTPFPPHDVIESALYYARLLDEDGAWPLTMSLEDVIKSATPRHRIYNYVTGCFDKQGGQRPCFMCESVLDVCDCQRNEK